MGYEFHKETKFIFNRLLSSQATNRGRFQYQFIGEWMFWGKYSFIKKSDNAQFGLIANPNTLYTQADLKNKGIDINQTTFHHEMVRKDYSKKQWEKALKIKFYHLYDVKDTPIFITVPFYWPWAWVEIRQKSGLLCTRSINLEYLKNIF